MENGSQIKYFFGVGTLVMVLTVLAVIVFIILYRSRLARMQKNEAEHLLNISREFDSRERKKIAADIHDSVCGDLSAIKNYVAIIEGQNNNSKDRAILSEIKTNLNTVLANAKSISYNLMPPLIESSGFVAALENYIAGIQRMHAVNISVDSDTEQGCLSPSQSYEVFRVTQELFNNMLRHGKISKVYLKVKTIDNCFVVEISDDGMPYSLEQSARSSTGMGLQNIYYRMSLLKGKIIQHSDQYGNHLKIIIPT